MTDGTISPTEFKPSTSLPGNSGIKPNGAAADESATLRTLRDSDLEMFAKHGIPHDLLANTGVERVTDSEARERFGITGSTTEDMAGIVFQYYSPENDQRVSARGSP